MKKMTLVYDDDTLGVPVEINWKVAIIDGSAYGIWNGEISMVAEKSGALAVAFCIDSEPVSIVRLSDLGVYTPLNAGDTITIPPPSPPPST